MGTTTKQQRKAKSKQGFAKNFLSLDSSMHKGPSGVIKASTDPTIAQQVMNAKQQYENCCLNTQMVRGPTDNSRSISSCSNYNTNGLMS